MIFMNKKYKENYNSSSKTFFPQKKKKFGQHFLRKQSVVDHMIQKVLIDPQTYVREIGCGDGFLTKSILNLTKC